MTDKLREAAEKYAGKKNKADAADCNEWNGTVAGFIAGAHYQKLEDTFALDAIVAQTRQETIAEVCTILMSDEMREWYVNAITACLKRAMEGEEK